LKYDQNLYQDIWVRGLRIKGQRECEFRYQSIKNYFEQYKSEKLNILDFGAIMVIFIPFSGGFS